MTKTRTEEKRSWLTAILGGVVAMISFYFAFASFRPTFQNVLIAFAVGAFGVLAAIIALQGKPKTLRELIDSWFYLP